MNRSTIAATLLACVFFPCKSFADDDFKSLFNGKDLSGWDGNPELWTVEDGSIVGRTSGPDHLAYNQFLIWRGGEVENFDFRAMIKQDGNNSGIQYRSSELPEIGKWSVGGYQCDVHPTAANNAMVYGEKAGGILALNGQNMIVDPSGKQWLVSQSDPVEVDVTQWNEYRIIANGNQITHQINGKTTVEFKDFDLTTRLKRGLLAFQIHRGPAMTVHIKDVMLKELPAGGFVDFDPSMMPAGTKPLKADAPPAKGKGKGAGQGKGKKQGKKQGKGKARAATN